LKNAVKSKGYGRKGTVSLARKRGTVKEMIQKPQNAKKKTGKIGTDRL
jgi:hypothetical protein